MDQMQENNSKSMNFFERVIKVFYQPGAVMAQVKQKPMILFPWLGLLVIGFVVAYLTTTGSKEQIVAALMAQNPNIQITDGYLNMMVLIGFISAGIMLAISPFIWGLLSHLTALITGGRGNVKQTLSVSLFAMYISLIGGLVSFLVGKAIGFPGFTFSLGAALPNLANPFLKVILMHVEVFTLWTIGVMAIGYKKVHEISMTKGIVIAFVPQIIFILLSVLSVMMTQSITPM